MIQKNITICKSSSLVLFISLEHNQKEMKLSKIELIENQKNLNYPPKMTLYKSSSLVSLISWDKQPKINDIIQKKLNFPKLTICKPKRNDNIQTITICKSSSLVSLISLEHNQKEMKLSKKYNHL
jgi:hypothetical protein